MEGVAEEKSDPCSHRVPEKTACAQCFDDLRRAYVEERSRSRGLEAEVRRARAEIVRARADKKDLCEVLDIIEAHGRAKEATVTRKVWAHTLRDIIIKAKGDPRK